MSPLRMLLFRLSSDHAFLLRFLADPKPIYAAYHLTPDEVAKVEQRSLLWPILLGGTPSRVLQTPEAPTATAGAHMLMREEDDDENGGGENGGGGGDDDDDDTPQPEPPQEPPPQSQPPQEPPVQPFPLPSLWPPLLEPPQEPPPLPPLPVGPAMLPPQPDPPLPPLGLPPIYYGPISPPQVIIPPLPNHIVLSHLGGKLKDLSSPMTEKAVNLAKAARTSSGADRLNNVRAMIKEL
jgi:hypothetical protein